MSRAHNFNAGPAVLPESVLQEAAKAVLELGNLGMSILEISHRSKDFDAIIQTAEADLREILGLSDEFAVMFLQGGASHQFAMIPYNFLLPGTSGNYVVTGEWAKKALKEAKVVGETYVSATSEESRFDRIPSSLDVAENAAYLHLTSNNTIWGTQFKMFPDKKIPVIADMSSDFLSRPLNMNQFSMIYGGAQKNAGPAGLTIVIIKKSMLEKQNGKLLAFWNYKTHIDKASLYNTPSVYAIYVTGLVFKWIKQMGGLAAVDTMNQEKAKLIYDLFDQYPDFYKGHAQAGSRSLMNITFRLPSEELEKKFLEEAKKENMVGLKGHRDVGGLRASMYNALPLTSAKALALFMESFVKRS